MLEAVVRPDRCVARDQDEAVDARLRDEQSVERVAMVIVEKCDLLSVVDGHAEPVEALLRDFLVGSPKLTANSAGSTSKSS